MNDNEKRLFRWLGILLYIDREACIEFIKQAKREKNFWWLIPFNSDMTIKGSFTWGESEKGHDYWASVHNKMRPYYE